MATPTVLVKKLGRISYSRALALQKALASHYKHEQAHGQVGELLFCEHDPPVYTFGLRETNYHQKAAELERLGCEVHKVRRGGLTTFHGPGQLVCYPVLNLRKLRVGVRDYVRSLETAMIGTLKEVGVEGFTTENTGVWVNHPEKGECKIGSIGIQVSHGVSYHGVAVNCSVDLSWFSHITPCGVEGKGVTSLTDLTSSTIPTSTVQPLLAHQLAHVLAFQLELDKQETLSSKHCAISMH